MASTITPQDYELLSAYLDGALSEAERKTLEGRLRAEPSLAAALNDLRATVQVMRAAPRLKPPRNFTLDPARYGVRKPWWQRAGLMQLTGAVGAFASLVLIMLALFFTSGARASPTTGWNTLPGSGCGSRLA